MVTPSKAAIEAELQMSFSTYEAALAEWRRQKGYGVPPPAPSTPEEYSSQAEQTSATSGQIKTFGYTAANTGQAQAKAQPPPLNLEVAEKPIGEQKLDYEKKDYSFAAISEPLQLAAGAARVGENILGPILQPFIKPLTGYEYKEDIYEPPTFRVGKALGTIALVTGGGAIGERMAIERGLTESVFVGTQTEKGGFTLTEGTVVTKQPRYFGLGKKEIAQTEVLLKQQAIPIKEPVYAVKGLGKAGENLLVTKSIVSSQENVISSIGIVESYSPTGRVTTSRVTSIGREVEGTVYSAAAEGAGGRTISMTTTGQGKPSVVYGSGGVETASAVDKSISSSMTKSTFKSAPPVVQAPSVSRSMTTSSARVMPEMATAPAKQEIKQNVMTSTRQDKVYRQRTISGVARVPRPRQAPTSAAMQTPRQEKKVTPITIPMPASRQGTYQSPIQDQPTRYATTTKSPTPARPINFPARNIPLTNLPAARWPMSFSKRARTRIARMPSPRMKPRRSLAYTPSLTAWAGNIKKKVSRAERKAKYTGLEVRPIPLDMPRKRIKRRRLK